MQLGKLTDSRGLFAAVTSGSATAGAAEALGVAAVSAMPRLMLPNAGGVKALPGACLLLLGLLSGTDKGRRAPATALRGATAAPHTSLLAGELATRAPELDAFKSMTR